MNRFRSFLGKSTESVIGFSVEAVRPIADLKSAVVSDEIVATEVTDPLLEQERFYDMVDLAIASHPDRTDFIRRTEAAFCAGSITMEQAADYIIGPDRS